MDMTEKARENRVRRFAERQGLRLVKSRRRDPRAVSYGRYRVETADGVEPARFASPMGWGLTLGEAEARLAQSPARDSIAISDQGGFNPIRTEDLPVTGTDGHGKKTPTVRELTVILGSLPDRFQDLPVTRYCDEGVAGINHGLRYEREDGSGAWTEHVLLW